MSPTNYLRFVNRLPDGLDKPELPLKPSRILQQKWTSEFVSEQDEWRDVPLVLEESK